MYKLKNSKVTCIKSGSSMKDAAELMTTKRIRHLPIIDENHEIISMLSKHDLTEVNQFQQLPVDLFASSPVECFYEHAPLSAVGFKMIERKISSVLLKNNENEVVGIITSDDLIYQLSKILKHQEEKKEKSEFNMNMLVTTAGDFFKKLSDIGI